MTPCPYPQCFAGTGPFFNICLSNGFNINVMSNALGRFMCYDYMKYLYICGGGQARLFFEDLKLALSTNDEIDSYTRTSFSFSGYTKTVIHDYNSNFEPISSINEHIILRFHQPSEFSYRHFNRQDLAAFIFCGNSEDGPLREYQCATNDICVKYPSYVRCETCETVAFRGRLSYRPRYYLQQIDEDEGCIVEPLGIPHKIFEDSFDMYI